MSENIKTWPVQIWLQHGDDHEPIPPFHRVLGAEDAVTWCQDNISESDVPYVRADLYEQLQQQLNDARSFIAKLTADRASDPLGEAIAKTVYIEDPTRPRFPPVTTIEIQPLDEAKSE